MAIALGLCMIALGTTSILLAQDDRDTAMLRRNSAASLLTSDSAIAEILTIFSDPSNARLLGKNYDPIHPKTGTHYLGSDGIPNSGDEDSTAVNEWQIPDPACLSSLGVGTPTLSLTQTLNPQSSYRLLAYRYHPNTQSGHILVEGIHNNIPSQVYVNLSIKHDSREFPGISVHQSAYWQGRRLTGHNSNFYFHPQASASTGLSGKATPTAANRADYLDGIWSGPSDNLNLDSIEGNLVACAATSSLSYSPQGTTLGTISTSRSLAGNPDSVTHYQADRIELSDSEVLEVDTTAGPVYLYVNGVTELRGNAKIRNVRTDGALPRVGDFRLLQVATETAPLVLYDTTCIQDAFIYSPEVDVHLLTTGDGCPGPGNSSIQGVLWAEDIENSTDSASVRPYDRDGAPNLVTSGVTTGIEVPENVSSLVDLLEAVNLPVFYKITGVNAWNKVRL
ncbi:hypothetical protein [Lyngbya confervoides]|uniref:Uncharacterized protein n=1 Tax=Lyngbya confervoides BDU141951 TaxID=1574623 RepID=A0ABD4T2V7_9CYAN|nr:hypothetical protein [Lyngbya confervoides]MCM1983072.1 hypothetical protein [Lyngbya confervoides BDU141951]